MRIGSLFSGIGGLELGLEWAGVGRTVWQVERDPFCRRVLAKHWPDAARFEDVRTVGAHNLAPVEVICGGFPCQDISFAGRGAGLAGERSGLWYEYARIVRDLRPRFVVVENVAALLTRGIDAVLGTLASFGYDTEWSCIRASDVGAAHRRDRVFIIAWMADSNIVGGKQPHDEAGAVARERSRPSPGWRSESHVANDDDERRSCQRRGGLLDGERAAQRDDVDGRGQRQMGDANVTRLEGRRMCGCGRADERPAGTSGSARIGGGQTQPGVGRATHGVSARLDVARPGEPQHEWEAPRVVASAQDRTARLKALGNAVVPQVAEVVGRRLLEIAGQS